MDIDDFTRTVKTELGRISNDNEKFIKAQKERHSEFEMKQSEIQLRLLELEQRAARRVSSGDDGYSDGGGHALRALLEGSAELRAMADGKARNAVMDLPRTFFSAPMAATLTSTGISYPDTRPGIVRPAERRLRVRDLLHTLETESGSIQFLAESGYTNAAAPVSESTEKPESSLSFELRTATVITLAHWCLTTTQCLADVSTMLAYLEGRLKFGLSDVEDQQLLLGSGIGNNLQGLYTTASLFAGGGGSPIDRLRHAADQLEVSDFEPSGIILHPSDWRDIQLLKDAEQRYIVGAPAGANPPRLWNLPIVTTRVLGQGTFLLGAFSDAAIIYDRLLPRLDVSFDDSDNFRKNLATCRVEERLALAVVRPEALIRGDIEGS